METEVVGIEKKQKRLTIISNVISLVITCAVALGTIYGFVSDTSRTVEQHTEDIREIKLEVAKIHNDITNTAIFKGMTEVEQTNMKDRVKRIEEKQDKMIDLLNSIKTNQK